MGMLVRREDLTRRNLVQTRAQRNASRASGTTCVNGACGNPKSQIVPRIDGDPCCPPGCSNHKDCLWRTSGVQQNVAPSRLTGWSECYTDTYDVPLETKVQAIVQPQCLEGKLMLACHQKGQPNWQLAAMGLRADVLFDCGSDALCTHVANGVGWYYSPTFSWGFASGSDPRQPQPMRHRPGAPAPLLAHGVERGRLPMRRHDGAEQRRRLGARGLPSRLTCCRKFGLTASASRPRVRGKARESWPSRSTSSGPDTPTATRR